MGEWRRRAGYSVAYGLENAGSGGQCGVGLRQSEFESEKKYRKAMMKIKQKNYDLHSLRCDLGYKLDIAREFQNDVRAK